MKKLTDITLQDLGYVSAACLLAATLTACGGGTATGDGSGDNGGGQGLITDTTTDTDLDGLPDSLEESISTDPNNPDSDADGVSDGDEWNTYFTDPLDSDSDNDGVSDGDEIATGGNPNDATDGTPDSGENTNNPEPTADRCDDATSANDEWQDNCVLRRFGTYARSAYTQGVQRILWCQSFDQGVTDINVFADGAFGPNTAASVREFQTANGLLVDGIVGPDTWGALFSKIAIIPDTSTNTSDSYSIEGCNSDVVQFYKEFDGLTPLGWKMARTPGSAEAVEFGSGAPY